VIVRLFHADVRGGGAVARAAGAATSTAWSSGITTPSKITSSLRVARMPRWSHVSSTR
jgi:hypothetical protein